jgi:hypothetical protein
VTTFVPARIVPASGAVWIRHPATITVALFVAAVGLRVWTPSDDASSTICFVRRCTGTSCPGCGLTRALAYLVRGDVGAMWLMHPLAPLIALDAIVAAGLVWVARSIAIKPQWIAIWAAVHVPLLIGVWLVRALGDTLPA